ncbi:MAG: PmoA family protein [Bryobacteraceae bacterium]|jgi:hypothetical protein
MGRGAVLFILGCVCLLTAPAQVHFTRQPDSIAVEIAGRPLTTFYFGPSAPKPYLHPLLAPSGQRLTRLYPMESVDSESRDHPHHRGLWITHGDVNGIDFWANETEQRKGKQGLIVLREIRDVQDGPAKGMIWAVFEWRDPDGRTLLVEDRVMCFSGEGQARTIHFDVTLHAVSKVVFGDTKEGFFAIRLRDELTELKGTGKMTNAAGQTGMELVWGHRSPWVDYCGTLDGRALGIAIFDHPANHAHPTWWHARDYGLFAANPFGERDFTGDKTKDASLTLAPGESVRFRYRVFIHPGNTAQAGVAAAYHAWAGE